MTIINNIASWIMKKRIHQIELFMKYPFEVQEEWLMNLVTTAKDTEWGKRNNFRSIENSATFKQRFPIQNYDSTKGHIERMMMGEKNILWPSNVTWFAKSSGTTSDKSKFIPVSEESLEECHFKGGKDMLAIYCNNQPDAKIFTGKSLVMGGSHQVNQLNDESYYGDLSAVLIQNLPFWAEFYRTPDISIALMDEWEAKIEMMAHATIAEDVTNITGVPTWTLILAKRILEITGKDHLLEVWPNLELYIHGAVNFNPYREQFKKLIPSNDMYYLETYNASEGFFGIQDQSDKNEMLLMLDYGIYYEFLPMEDYGNPYARTLDLSEVELNKNYAIIISTNGGLWRYMIGDTVKFTNLNPFRIQITGRTKHFINAFGEELIIENAEQALSAACRHTNAVIKEYTAAPIYFSDGDAGGHEWIIEFEKHPDSLDHFSELLDNHLKCINSDYEAKRHKDMALRFPIVYVAPEGTFYTWLKSKGKLGGQHKVPRLANDRTYIEQIMGMMKEAV
ncbi:GH3 auxin-responsive promoter family protein [Solitalea koreensis]|uniref:GH3 auxin-responsive promoter n=1 Tax=Solitalea koreensis TaxID=543615 RepID=A0A521CIX7_9SPHI|nr:GH3 auxin-responsive promoter family protein [Solitalea koreensis]SMO59378.1 GH3 auxin-responsive promoter [Solitalea koreensis]